MKTASNSNATQDELVARFIKFLITHEALLFGDFTTKSGRTSPYFINFGKICQATPLHTLATFYGEWLKNQCSPYTFKPFNVIFGPAYKGIPLAIALTLYLKDVKLFASEEQKLGYAFDRKEVKEHGDGGRSVGAPLTAQSKILLIDDVLTSGMSLENATTVIKEIAPKAEIVGILVGVDREERAQQQKTSAKTALAEKHKIPVQAITDIRTLLKIGGEKKLISPNDRDNVYKYLKEHSPSTSN